MTGRAAAVRNRLIVAVGAVLVAWLFSWGATDLGVILILVAVLALALAVMRGVFGGVPVLYYWLIRYRAIDIGLRELGDIIGEHRDDMQRAGLVVRQGMRRPSFIRPTKQPRARPGLVPRLRHRSYPDGIVVSLEAVRAGMSQEEIVAALPRLRSAWGVDVVSAEVKPGGRIVEFTIPVTDSGRSEVEARIAEAEPSSPREPAPMRARPQSRPPDAPTVVVPGGGRAVTTTTRSRPPTIEPQLRPDAHGRYQLTMLPADAARTFSPERVDGPRQPPAGSPPPRGDGERGPRTDEIPVIEAPERLPAREPAEPVTSRNPVLNGGGDRANPTDVDERELRIGAHWRTGKQR